MENWLALDQRKERKTLGFLAKMSVGADGAKEGADEPMSTSYLVDFCIV